MPRLTVLACSVVVLIAVGQTSAGPQLRAFVEDSQSPTFLRRTLSDDGNKHDDDDSADSPDGATQAGSGGPDKAAAPFDAAAPIDAAAPTDASLVATGGICNANGGGDFWNSGFLKIVKECLGKPTYTSCKGDPYVGNNGKIASGLKNALKKGSGSSVKMEVLTWNAVHGHDHQGANVKTAEFDSGSGCDGGMSGKNPGDNCPTVGGTFHSFCTGSGKSEAVFIYPANTQPQQVDVAKFAKQCAHEAHLLIKYTKCIMDTSKTLLGVIALPTTGNKAPNSDEIRVNQQAFTAPCSPTLWVACVPVNVDGRSLTVYAVQPHDGAKGGGASDQVTDPSDDAPSP